MTLSDVVRWRMCTGCGACVFACPSGMVSMVDVPGVGWRPVFRDAFRDSRRYSEICPGFQTIADLADQRTDDSWPCDPYLGRLVEQWEGWAADPFVRMRGSSGGLLTALSLYCIEAGGMTGVLHSGMDPEKPWRNRTMLSRHRAEIVDNSGSRYSPASPCNGLDMVLSADGSCAFIGKPTDVTAVQLLRRSDRALNRKLGLVMSFFCAGTPATQGTVDLLADLGIDPAEVVHVRYRGNGWPGGFEVITKAKRRVFIPYEDAWPRLTHYKPLRENLDPDGFGRNADISCGDAWHIQEREGNPGVSVALVRTERGRSILHAAEQAGYVVLRPTTPERILAGQIYLANKQRELYGRLLALRMFRIPYTNFTGFALKSSWRELKFSRRIRVVLGTLRRIITRKLWKTADFG